VGDFDEELKRENGVMDINERARRYVEKLDAAVSGSGGHSATYQVAVVLVQGFALSDGEAWTILCEYNQRCAPPWSEHELRHKLKEAGKANPRQKRGWLAGADQWKPSGKMRETVPDALPPAVRKPEYVPDALAKVAGEWAGVVDLVWLADRSETDPALVGSAGFLDALYDREKEKVLVFSRSNKDGMPCTQGEAVWPADEDNLPKTGRNGVFYLAAPVDGVYRETGREDKLGNPVYSRRDGRAVTSWRWMVVESDDAPAREWLAAIARLPLAICALYTSGGRSVHALVRVDARTKEEWDEAKAELKPGLVTLGADPGCMSAVRLTRLPGAWRENKNAPQKLLYLNPRADGRPIIDLPRRRDVVAEWCGLAENGPADSDETAGQWMADGLSYYARRSEACRVALEKFEAMRWGAAR
jgi:hypothetical protein